MVGTIHLWWQRIRMFALIILSFVLLGNLSYLIQERDLTKINDLYSFVAGSFVSQISLFEQFSYDQKIGLVFGVNIILLCVVFARLYFKTFIVVTAMVVLFVIGCVFIKPALILNMLFYYIENNAFVAIITATVTFITFQFIYYSHKGKQKILSVLFLITEIISIAIFIAVCWNHTFLMTVNFIYVELKNSIQMLRFYLDITSISFVLFVGVAQLIITAQSIIHFIKRKKEMQQRGFIDVKRLPNIGITIPAFNEESVILETISSILSADYPKHKKNILIVCDGSLDFTHSIVGEHYQMVALPVEECLKSYDIPCSKIKGLWQSYSHPNIRMIYKSNEGKYDALNTGLAYHSKDVPWILNIDADTKISKDSLMKFATEILRDKDITALAGMVVPSYQSSNPNVLKRFFSKLIVSWQNLDYMVSFHVVRGGFSIKNSLFIISGAFGMFKRESLIEVGGYRKGLGEDMDITLKLQEYNQLSSKKIVYVPEAVAYTAPPTNLKDLSKQRKRWFKGLLECLFHFKKFALKKGVIFSYAYFLFIELLSPLLIPAFMVMLIINHSILYSSIFQISIGFSIMTYFAQLVTGLYIENHYRKLTWSHFSSTILSFFIWPLTLIWRNDAFLQFNNKEWGKMKKKFR